jgi:hypothetical protein
LQSDRFWENDKKNFTNPTIIKKYLNTIVEKIYFRIIFMKSQWWRLELFHESSQPEFLRWEKDRWIRVLAKDR